MQNISPQTFLAHPAHNEFRTLLERLFLRPDHQKIAKEAALFLRENSFPMDDFPELQGSYSRTILYRAANNFECLAARWCKGAVSKIHGHPEFTFVTIITGKFLIENFQKTANNKVVKTAEEIVTAGQSFSMQGRRNRFDNGIHRITPLEAGLSIHIYSDNALQGEIFEV